MKPSREYTNDHYPTPFLAHAVNPGPAPFWRVQVYQEYPADTILSEYTETEPSEPFPKEEADAVLEANGFKRITRWREEDETPTALVID
jgi:hypothetical protein